MHMKKCVFTVQMAYNNKHYFRSFGKPGFLLFKEQLIHNGVEIESGAHLAPTFPLYVGTTEKLHNFP